MIKVLLSGFGASLLAAACLHAAPVLSENEAREKLKQGALLVDVRTPAEYAAGHLPNAVNIPLGMIKEKLPPRVPAKGKVLLLHCQSGQRSAAAERELRALGYTNAFNIGSYARAKAVVTPAK